MPEGGCRCGAVRYAAGPPLWSAICHCRDCRHAAGADSVAWFGVANTALTWTGTRRIYRSAPRVTRSFCGICGTPLSFASTLFPDETHLYAVTLDDEASYAPTAHIWWSERAPWVTVGDGLPCHAKGLQDAADHGKTIL